MRHPPTHAACVSFEFLTHTRTSDHREGGGRKDSLIKGEEMGSSIRDGNNDDADGEIRPRASDFSASTLGKSSFVLAQLIPLYTLVVIGQTDVSLKIFPFFACTRRFSGTKAVKVDLCVSLFGHISISFPPASENVQRRSYFALSHEANQTGEDHKAL